MARLLAKRHWVSFVCSTLLFLPFLTLSVSVSGYESDQYMNREELVTDSLEVMDGQVNLAITSLSKAGTYRTERAFARAIYYELGGWYWADKIERWAGKSPLVDKYSQTRHKSVYRSMPIWATRVNFIFGVGRSFRVNGVMVGSDKFGHFFSQGFKYFKRELRGDSTESLLGQGVFAERWLFGQLTTGVFSNADLVANFEGWRFYQSLFRDDVIPGKPAILQKQGDRYVQQRAFTWADHINDYWDEALNPSFNVKSLDWRLRDAIAAMCDEYEANPGLYTPRDDAVLWQRYSFIGLRDARVNQFSSVCAGK